MRKTSGFKTIFAAGIALLIISCGSKSKDKVTVTEITLQDITQEKVEDPPPPPPPPKDSFTPVLELKTGQTKCFVNEGLKYKTTITLSYNNNETMGIVSSEELGSGKKESTAFTGTWNNNGFFVKFIKGKPPVIGDASEWTDSPWIFSKEGGKETLRIIFEAKNYETNKWELTDYEFVLADCK